MDPAEAGEEVMEDQPSIRDERSPGPAPARGDSDPGRHVMGTVTGKGSPTGTGGASGGPAAGAPGRRIKLAATVTATSAGRSGPGAESPTSSCRRTPPAEPGRRSLTQSESGGWDGTAKVPS